MFMNMNKSPPYNLRSSPIRQWATGFPALPRTRKTKLLSKARPGYIAIDPKLY